MCILKHFSFFFFLSWRKLFECSFLPSCVSVSAHLGKNASVIPICIPLSPSPEASAKLGGILARCWAPVVTAPGQFGEGTEWICICLHISALNESPVWISWLIYIYIYVDPLPEYLSACSVNFANKYGGPQFCYFTCSEELHSPFRNLPHACVSPPHLGFPHLSSVTGSQQGLI